MISSQGQSTSNILIYGAGGHGQVVAEAAAAAGFTVLGFIDDQAKPGDTTGLPLFNVDDPRIAEVPVILGIGDNMARRRLMEDLKASGREIATVVHPSAYVAESAVLSEGAFVGANAVVNSSAYVGLGAIVNDGAILEHHCRLGDYAHLAPGAVTGGEITIGDYALVGLGSRLISGVRIGDHATVGIGAVVLQDVRDNATVVGVPAKEYVKEEA